jgi:hypothetical protein
LSFSSVLPSRGEGSSWFSVWALVIRVLICTFEALFFLLAGHGGERGEGWNSSRIWRIESTQVVAGHCEGSSYQGCDLHVRMCREKWYCIPTNCNSCTNCQIIRACVMEWCQLSVIAATLEERECRLRDDNLHVLP